MAKSKVYRKTFNFPEEKMQSCCHDALQISMRGLLRTRILRKISAVTSPQWGENRVQVLRLFRRIDESLSVMKTVNPGLTVNLEEIGQKYDEDSMSIDLGEKRSHDYNPKDPSSQEFMHKGEFKFFASFDPKIQQVAVLMYSPVSGKACKYVYDADNDWWSSIEDGHLLHEFFSREIMRVCEGFPNL